MEKIYKFDISDLLNDYQEEELEEGIEEQLDDFDNDKEGLDISVVVKVRER